MMKVTNINPVIYNYNTDKNISKKNVAFCSNSLKELGAVTADFNVKLPQKYTKLGVVKLPNGTEMHSYKLENGHKITIVPMEGSQAVVKNYVNVGSLNETDDIKGISHFLEHMAFNGTKGSDGYEKLEQGDSFNKIEKLGGWVNASTSHSMTDYVNITPMLEDSDLEKQIRIMAAMTENLELSEKMTDKEKGPVCSEIDMILDDPDTVALDNTVRSLFNIKSSADELVGGSVKHIKNLSPKDVRSYYEKYYTPDNMNLVITGDVNPDKTIELVAKEFRGKKKVSTEKFEEKLTPIKTSVRKDFINENIKSTSTVIGFAGPKFGLKEYLLSNLATSYLNSSQVGMQKLFEDNNISVKGYVEKVSTNKDNPLFIPFMIESEKENSEKALKIFYDKVSGIQKPTPETLKVLKKKLITDYEQAMETSLGLNSYVGLAVSNDIFESLPEYENIINSFTEEDVYNYIKEYINLDKAAITVVHPKTTAEQINSNYDETKGISFKGRSARKPINFDKAETKTLDNNYNAAFYETKSNNVCYNLDLNFDMPDMNKVNPAAFTVLGVIYNMGNLKYSKDEYKNFLEKNNIDTFVNLSKTGLSIIGLNDNDDAILALKNVNDILKRPSITQENLEFAIKQVKSELSKSSDNSSMLLSSHLAKTNSRFTSKEDLVKNIDKLTLDDLKDLHNYIVNNSTGTFAMSIPETSVDLKDKVIKEVESFNPVKSYEYKNYDFYKTIEKSEVLTKVKNMSQADIMQTYLFKNNDTPKEIITGRLLNELLSSSKSIGLFNTLREKEQLAYSVYSSLDKIDDVGMLSCNILTTTDNKTTGTQSYDNLQKSINGFNRQIGKLRNSEFTDEDLETAKKRIKSVLLNMEGNGAKVESLSSGLNSKEGINHKNILFETVDTITRDDIVEFADKIFSNPPIYSIVASKDTLEANKEYLKNIVNHKDSSEIV